VGCVRLLPGHRRRNAKLDDPTEHYPGGTRQSPRRECALCEQAHEGRNQFHHRIPRKDRPCAQHRAQGDFMRIVALSDTHGKHERLQVPDGDLLLFAGDCSFAMPPYPTRTKS